MKTALAITRTLSRRYYPLHPEEQEALASIMECRRVDKGELLLEEGRIARHFHYVESGMLRQYYYKNGHDITEHFSCEDDLVFCIISLFRQEPTRLMIEAIEPTVVYDIPYTGLQELFVFYTRTNIDSRRKCIQKNAAIIQENFRMGPYGIPEQSRLLAIRNCQGTL